MANGKKRVNSAYTHSMQDGKQIFDFGSIGRLTFNADQVSAANRARAMAHGFKQRIIDNAAIKASDDGRVDVRAKFDAMKTIIEHLESGSDNWNIKAAPRATGPDAGLTIRAMIALGKASTPDHAERLFAAIGEKRGIERDAVVALFWAAKDIATKVAELKAQDRTYTVDSDELLEGLDDLEEEDEDEDLEDEGEESDEE